MNRDQVKGRIKTVRGEVKAVAGKALGNQRLAENGTVEKVVGDIQTGYGDLKEKLESDQ